MESYFLWKLKRSQDALGWAKWSTYVLTWIFLSKKWDANQYDFEEH